MDSLKDKFDIFIAVMYKEAINNHFGTYITVGQFADVLGNVHEIYNNWNDSLSLKENINIHFNRSISPLGTTGKNKL